MAIPKTLRNLSLFVDGRGYAGKISELELPKLTIKTEEFRGGGMDAPIKIDMGMEALDASFSLVEFNADVIGLFGLSNGNAVSLTFRGAHQADGDAEAIEVNMRGGLTEVDAGTWKPGDQASVKFAVNCRYLKLAVAGQTIIEIDVENMIRRINGQDQLASQRRALGL